LSGPGAGPIPPPASATPTWTSRPDGDPRTDRALPATISYQLEAAAGATTLVNSVELDPSQAKLRLLAPLAAPRIKAAVTQNLGKLKLLLERPVQHKDFCRGNAIGTIKANYIK